MTFFTRGAALYGGLKEAAAVVSGWATGLDTQQPIKRARRGPFGLFGSSGGVSRHLACSSRCRGYDLPVHVVHVVPVVPQGLMWE
ncbi:MAG: hypothetical protein ABGY24_03410, partial [bacterium]